MTRVPSNGGLPGFGLGPRLAFIIALVALIASGTLGVVAIESSRAALRQQIQASNLAATDLTAAFASTYVEAAQMVARDLAQRPSIVRAVVGGVPEQVQTELARAFVSSSHFSGISIIDLQGVSRVTATLTRPVPGPPSTDRDWFQQAMATRRPYLGLPTRGRASGLPNVPYGVPILDERGTVRGVLIAGISLDALGNALSRIARGNSTTASLLDLRQNGFILVDARPERVLQPFEADNAIALRLLAGEEGILQTTGESGEAVLAAYAQVPDVPWGVIIQQQTSAAFAPIEALSQQTQVWLALALMVATAIGLVLARQITGPLAQLRQAANAFAAGDLSQRLAFTRRDEIGELGNAFDGMASSLAVNTARLEQANSDLQLQIGERQQAELGLRRALAELSAQYQETERARAEERAVLDASGEAMTLLAADGRVLRTNRSFTEFFGLLPDEVTGHRFADLHAEIKRAFDDPEAFHTLVSETAADTDQLVRGLLAVHWPQARILHLYSTPVRDVSGRHLGRLYLFRDVTNEQEVDRMKTEFVSLVSHELRTPLTSIKGYVDLLIDGAVGELEPVQVEFLEIVQQNTDRLVSLINDLLDISRIEAGRMELHLVPVDLLSVVRNVMSLLGPQIAAKGQHLELRGPDTLPAVVADANRITQVLTNLLSNAYKYTPSGGRIAITVHPEPSALRIAVRDTGVGLTADDQAKLFTKFFRAANPKTQDVSGTGLGLTITRSLVEMHGGKMQVESTPGEGSEFSFTLPLVQEEASVGR